MGSEICIRDRLDTLFDPHFIVGPPGNRFPTHILEYIKTNSLYESYIERQDADIKAYRKDERLKLPKDLDFEGIGGLSTEAKQALVKTGPRTLGHASRVPGVTPAAIMILMRHVKTTRSRAKELANAQ